MRDGGSASRQTTFEMEALVSFLGPDANDRKYLQFDGLRAFAVLFVIYQHWLYNSAIQPKFDKWYHVPFKMPIGGLGVAIFFVLSGLLITEILMKGNGCAGPERRHFLKAFYIRRSLRIFPIYYLTIGVMAAFDVEPFREHFVWLALYAANILVFLEQAWIGPASHLWTLAVEEQFYLFWPIAALLFTRSFERFAVAFVLCSISTRLVLAVFFPDITKVGQLPIISMEAIAIGGLLALDGAPARFVEKLSARLAWLPAVTYPMMALGIEHALLDFTGHLAIVFFGVWCVTRAKAGISGAIGRLLMNRFVRFLGVTSYGLYLYHNFAGTLVNALLGLVGRQALSHNLPLNLLMMTTVTLILTVLSWALIEKPINSLKRFVPYFPGTPREQQQPSATAGAAVSS